MLVKDIVVKFDAFKKFKSMYQQQNQYKPWYLEVANEREREMEYVRLELIPLMPKMLSS